MVTKALKVIVLLACIAVVITACESLSGRQQGYLHKDLSEQMDALQVYQGAIGEEIKRGTPENALWLVEGLDSVLQLITERLNTHHSLQKPFDAYYESKMQEPVTRLQNSIAQKDTAAAHSAYRLLVRKCNSCHNEHDVEERAHY